MGDRDEIASKTLELDLWCDIESDDELMFFLFAHASKLYVIVFVEQLFVLE